MVAARYEENREKYRRPESVRLAHIFVRVPEAADAGNRRVSTILLALPLFGDLAVQSAMYRFSSNLALLLKSGIPMLDALAALEAVMSMAKNRGQRRSADDFSWSRVI